MIQKTRWLGLPLRTRAQRRSLVMGYAVLVTAPVVFLLVRGGLLPGVLLAQAFSLAGLLGGLQAEGPVKLYRQPASDRRPVELHLNGRRAPDHPEPLDEREAAERDHAHYLAYRIVRWVVPAAACALYFVHLRVPATMGNAVSTLGWLLAWFVLALPQMVLLWCEPEGSGQGELELVHSTH